MAINLSDYSRTAAQRGWGAGWPSCRGAKTAGTAIVTAGRSGTRFSVHKRIARLVDLLVDETERRGYLLVPGQCGGYNCRAIGGTNSPSNHSWALALDVNWAANPMRRPLRTNIPGWLPPLWARYGFAWGGDYKGTPDPMHLEFMGTPADADRMTALAVRELTGAPAPAPAAPKPSPKPSPGPSARPVLRQGSTGAAVRTLQTVLARWYPDLRLAVDGDFGPATANAVRRLQRNSGLVVDAIVGPATYRALGF